MVLVSRAACSVAVRVARTGLITASFRSAGSGRRLTARTWTLPTLPTSSGSVPGRAGGGAGLRVVGDGVPGRPGAVRTGGSGELDRGLRESDPRDPAQADLA